uniref:Integrase catalytic domain-containing protein n=1 Tax=Meloidogyne enterolobii TaxID=390850 RepID=A0A6V7X0Y6_MELEN|nr:unnamed protein product [Meloidogyne enterolobii]
MATRFTHLELVPSLSAKSCIQAMRRFISEYGKPKYLISDNGTQYKLTCKVIQEIEQKTEKEKIHWHFIPSLSPWFGGLYEAMVKIMKNSLKAAIGRKMLNYEELRTILSEIKTIMNKRPLTYVYENFDDAYTVLRPIDLILPSRNEENIEIEISDEKEFLEKETQRETLIKEWQNSNQMLNHFWQKWEKEYLNKLKERADKHNQKLYKKNYLPEIGEIVLIQNKQLPRQAWNLGKIVELIKSKDGLIRIAKVRVKGKIITRAIALLYPMELKAEMTSKIIENEKAKIENNELKNENQKTHKMELRAKKKINYKEIESESEEEKQNIEQVRIAMFRQEMKCSICGRSGHPSQKCWYRRNEFVNQNNQNLNQKEKSPSSKVETDWQESYKILEGKYLTLEEKLNSVENDLSKEKIEKEAIGNELKKQEREILEIKNCLKELTEKEKSKEELNNEIERHKNDLIRIRTEFCTSKKEKEDKGSNQKSKQTNALKILAKSSVTLLTLLIIFLLTFGKVAEVQSIRCAQNENLVLKHLEECKSNGLVIFERKDKSLCWKEIGCNEKNKHIRWPTKNIKYLCDEKCTCPDWAEQCTFFKGQTEVKNVKIKEILENNKPKICSTEENIACAKTFEIKEFNQIELISGEKHLVNELKIELEDAIKEFTCIGKGKEITGSPRYCSKYHCSEKGTRFCFYPRIEKAFFVAPEGRVEIKAWGRVKIKIYGFPKKETSICKGCELKCTKEGIQVKTNEMIGGIEICNEKKCFYRALPEKIENITLSHEIILEKYKTDVQFYKNGELIKRMKIECEKLNICEIMNCIFCFERLMNPHCFPEVSMILFGILVYFCSNLIYICIKIIILVLKVTFWVIKHKIKFIRFIAGKSKRQEEIKNESKPKPTKPLIIKKKRPMKVIVALIFLINLSKCFCLTSLQATEESCVVNKLGERSCSFEKIIVLTFNPEEQQIQVSLNDHTGKILGTLTMEIHKTKAFCNKSLKYFSRFFHIQIESSKRCAETGSCYDLKCSELKSYEKLIEFNATNDYPGITQCVESSGGWFSGCFYTTPACTFYRFYATPVDERILEIFECPKWELGLSMNLTIDTNEGKWESAFNLVPGMASRQSKNKIEITLKSITTPILPVLNKNFVFDGKKAAMLDYEIETQLNKFKCANKYQAGNFNCTVDPLTCSCRPADDNVNCLCTEIIKDEQIFQESNNLPFDHNGILVKVDHGEITAFPDLTSAEVQIKIEGMILKTEISMNTCIVRANLTGCFDCKKGAHVDLECKTDFGSTLANIICPSAKNGNTVPTDY